MEHYLNYTNRRTQTYCEKNLCHGQFVHHKSRTDLPGIESRPSAVTARPQTALSTAPS